MLKNYKYYLENLDCANCALELERAIKKIDGIKDVNINFILQKMKLEYDEVNKEDIILNVKKTIKKEEPDVTIEEM